MGPMGLDGFQLDGIESDEIRQYNGQNGSKSIDLMDHKRLNQLDFNKFQWIYNSKEFLLVYVFHIFVLTSAMKN